jgi:hypothetical protein
MSACDPRRRSTRDFAAKQNTAHIPQLAGYNYVHRRLSFADVCYNLPIVSSERTDQRMFQPAILVALAIVLVLAIALICAVVSWLFGQVGA